jgi:serpin B
MNTQSRRLHLQLNRATAVLIAFIVAIGLGCANMNAAKNLGEGNTAFAADLYQRVKSGDANLFFSPYSLSSALAMTYTGARGRTATEMAATLHFDLPAAELPPAFAALDQRLAAVGRKKEVALKTANSLWLQHGYHFQPEFLKTGRKSFGAELSEVDFAKDTEGARNQINKWVAGKTADKIPELLKPRVLDSSTRLVLCNAIYFKGDWAKQFDPKATHPANFFVTPERAVQAPMMSQKAKLRSATFDGFSAFELRYQGGGLSMVVLLPEAKDGLGALEAKLDGTNLVSWLETLDQATEAEGIVQLPKFKLSSQFDLKTTLSAMGMPTAFGADSDFSGMDGTRDLAISAVVHQAVVEVNEQGTEAAAATAVVVGLRGVRVGQVWRADHPFVFLIRENQTGSVLFLGRVVDPTK